MTYGVWLFDDHITPEYQDKRKKGSHEDIDRIEENYSVCLAHIANIS